MIIKFERMKVRVMLLIYMTAISLLGMSMFAMQPVHADGSAVSSFQWGSRAAAVESWATPIQFTWRTTLAWMGDSYYTVALDGNDVAWQDLTGTSWSSSLEGAATITTLDAGNHEFCVTVNSYSSGAPDVYCLPFAIASTGDSNFEAATAEAQSLAKPEVQKAFQDCLAAAEAQGVNGAASTDKCQNSSAAFQGNLERWYRCRYGASMIFDVPYDSPRITEVCGSKPVYKVPSFRSGSEDGGIY
jgi:hypothetical protein